MDTDPDDAAAAAVRAMIGASAMAQMEGTDAELMTLVRDCAPAIDRLIPALRERGFTNAQAFMWLQGFLLSAWAAHYDLPLSIPGADG